MLTENLLIELEEILSERGPGETTSQILAMRAKRQRSIAKKYPHRGSPSGKSIRYDPDSGYNIVRGKVSYPTYPEKEKWEKIKTNKSRVTSAEKSALSKALKRVHQPTTPQSMKPPGRGKVIPFRARKAA